MMAPERIGKAIIARATVVHEPKQGMRMTMTKDRRLGFIGAGNMAQALIKGLLGSDRFQPEAIRASDANQLHLQEFGAGFGIGTGSNVEVAQASDVVVLAVKPQTMNTVLRELHPVLDERKLVVSIAAGVPLESIARQLQPGVRLIRTMPNTPALVGAGATAIAAGLHATSADVELCGDLFNAVGTTVVVDESLLDAVTGLSGSGPSYVFLIIEALADAGVRAGLGRQDALHLSAQTLYGAAKLLLDTGDHPSILKDRVTSPGGTSIAGLHALESGGLRVALMNAVEASATRARTLGEDFARQFDDEPASLD